jgi:hypothetical protein
VTLSIFIWVFHGGSHWSKPPSCAFNLEFMGKLQLKKADLKKIQPELWEGRQFAGHSGSVLVTSVCL